MRLVFHGFDDGSFHIFKTETKKGKTTAKTLEGRPGGYPQRKMVTVVEIACYDTPEGFREMMAGLRDLEKRVKESAKTPAPKMKKRGVKRAKKTGA